jgi:hypothetical protein
MLAAIDLDDLGWLPTLTFWIALAAWTLTFVGLACTLVRGAQLAR